MSVRREPRNPRVVLQADHERINAILGRLLAALGRDDRAEALKLWSSAEKGVLAHFDVEEMLVFPLLEEFNVVEVAGLRHQHDKLRSKLGKLGIDFELPAAPVERVAAFFDLLRAHEEREESLLYPQAESRIPVNVARSIFIRLKLASVA